jgi:hypothetical protein
MTPYISFSFPSQPSFPQISTFGPVVTRYFVLVGSSVSFSPSQNSPQRTCKIIFCLSCAVAQCDHHIVLYRHPGSQRPLTAQLNSGAAKAGSCLFILRWKVSSCMHEWSCGVLCSVVPLDVILCSRCEPVLLKTNPFLSVVRLVSSGDEWVVHRVNFISVYKFVTDLNCFISVATIYSYVVQ